MKDYKTEKAYFEHLGELGHSSLTSKKIEGYDSIYLTSLPDDKNACVYDYGCGYGDFLEYLILRGYKNISGGDINSECVRISSHRTNCTIDKIDDIQMFEKENNGKYDCINLKDVIEHIDKEKLIEFLACIKRTIKDNGYIIVSCPQICGFTSVYTLYDDFTHKTLFTESSLRYILRAAGYARMEIIIPRRSFSINPLRIFSRATRRLWFIIVKVIYMLERPGERAPTIPGDRISIKAWKNNIK